jgi:hypothetical protein
MNSIRLIDLPDEVIQNVLFRLNYTNALALEATCRRFRDVANEPLLWKSFCRDGWKKWQPRHNFKAKLAGSEFDCWKDLFAERTRSHREVCALIESIIEEDGNRIRKVERIVDLGWDAKDALLDGFRLAHLSEKSVLAQRWGSGGNLSTRCVDDSETGIGLRKCSAAYTERWPLKRGLTSSTTPQTNSLMNGRLVLLISLSSLQREMEISRTYVIVPAK